MNQAPPAWPSHLRLPISLVSESLGMHGSHGGHCDHVRRWGDKFPRRRLLRSLAAEGDLGPAMDEADRANRVGATGM